MRIADDEHRELSWRVHALASDFELLDVWQLPVSGDERPGSDFEAFTALMRADHSKPQQGPAAWLFRLRMWLGEVFGWDGAERLPIPGCSEVSMVERLPAELQAQAPAFEPQQDFQLVYRLEREQLLEISNGTVHALMHLGWVEQPDGRFAAQMAVYCKSRGVLGRLYMGLITPFRLLIVYPALMRQIGRRWRKQLALASRSAPVSGAAAA